METSDAVKTMTLTLLFTGSFLKLVVYFTLEVTYSTLKYVILNSSHVN